MKLKEFLKQFENLDPELEVYTYYEHDQEMLEKKRFAYDFAFISDKLEDYAYFDNNKTISYNTKILVL